MSASDLAANDANKTKLFYLDEEGNLVLNPHEGQHQILTSETRYLLALCGTQSGKTVTGPVWLMKEMQRRGPGDYLVVAPSFQLLDKKVLPATVELFSDCLHLGSMKGGKGRIFNFYDNETVEHFFGFKSKTKTKIFFGHAADPDSLESATAKAAWLDECGQLRFKGSSWQALVRRLAIMKGRALLTTTPYTSSPDHWLRKNFYQKAIDGDENYEVVTFKSTMNPLFSREEYENAKKTLPSWKFRMFYDGAYSRTLGSIYDCFDPDAGHVCKPFPIPDKWDWFIGCDFGGVNTCFLVLVEDPITKVLYVVDEYIAGNRTAKEHFAAVKKMVCGVLKRAVGGSWSEDQFRSEFRHAGMPISEPDISSVELGISRTYATIKTNRLIVFDKCEKLIEELQSYSRIVDEDGTVLEEIDSKSTYHHCDSLRYIVGSIRRDAGKWEAIILGGETERAYERLGVDAGLKTI